MKETGNEMEQFSDIVCIAMYQYKARLNDELSLLVGEIVRYVKINENGWWFGHVMGKGSGYFPANICHKCVNLDEKVNKKTKGNLYMAMYSFKPNRSDELELLEGQMIEVVGQPDDSWWQGRLNERFGFFPSNYVSGPFNIDKSKRDSITPTFIRSETSSMTCPPRKLVDDECFSPIVFSRKNTISSYLFEPEDEPDSYAIEIHSLSSCSNAESSPRSLYIHSFLKNMVISKPMISANESSLDDEEFDTFCSTRADILSTLMKPSVPSNRQEISYHEELCNLNKINFNLPGVVQLSCSDDSGVSFLDTSNSSNEVSASDNFKTDLAVRSYFTVSSKQFTACRIKTTYSTIEKSKLTKRNLILTNLVASQSLDFDKRVQDSSVTTL